MPNTNHTIVTITSDAGSPSDCCDTEGAMDFTVTVSLEGNDHRGEVTLCPDHTGALTSWGSVHNWLSDGLVKVVRRYTESQQRDLLSAIEAACKSDHQTYTLGIEIDAEAE